MLRQFYRKFWPALCIAALLLTASPPAAAQAAAALQLNDRGGRVVDLQKKLQALNYAIARADGIFGPETKRAVLAFQRDRRIKITGVVDARTWRELKRAKPAKPAQSARQSFPPAAAPSVRPAPVKAVETAPFVPQSAVAKIIGTAKRCVGAPYRFGGTTPRGFDCSGYVQYVFSQHKFSLPRSADAQFNIGKKIAPVALREGDLVFFSTYEAGPSHCGIYIGGGKFIHASSSKGVRVDALEDPYWRPRYLAAKRVVK